MLPGGVKGNKGGGRPPDHVKILSKQHTEDAIKTLYSIMMDKKSMVSARVRAAEALLDRGWGKASQPVTGEDGGPIQVAIQEILKKSGLE